MLLENENLNMNSNNNINIKTYLEAKQEELKGKICLDNKIAIDKLGMIAGVDLAYWKKDDREWACCCIVVLDFDTLEIFDSGDLGFIKIAKDREMAIDINVIELPIHILDNEPIDEKDWKLPEDKELESLLQWR